MYKKNKVSQVDSIIKLTTNDNKTGIIKEYFKNDFYTNLSLTGLKCVF